MLVLADARPAALLATGHSPLPPAAIAMPPAEGQSLLLLYMCPHTAAITMPPAARATCLPAYCYTCVRILQLESNAGHGPSAAATHCYICVLYPAMSVSPFTAVCVVGLQLQLEQEELCQQQGGIAIAAVCGHTYSCSMRSRSRRSSVSSHSSVSCILLYVCPHTAVCC